MPILENSLAPSYKHTFAIRSSDPTLKHLLRKRKHVYPNICIHMFTVVLFINAKYGKQLKGVSISERQIVGWNTQQ